MAYTRNEGVMSGAGPAPGGVGTPNVGRITGFLLIAAVVLTVAMFWLPVATFGGSGELYAWKSLTHEGGMGFVDYLSAVPYALVVIVAGLAGTLLAVGMGARRSVLFWVAAFAGGLVLQIASGDLVGYAQAFGDGLSPGSGFWVLTLVVLVAIAALVTGLRDAVASKRAVTQGPGGVSGGAADRVAGVFLIVAAVVNLAGSFLPLVPHESMFGTVWGAGRDGSLPLSAVQFAIGSIAVFVVAVALLAGAGVRNPAVRAASGAAAALMVANGVSALSVTFSVVGLNFWDYAGGGFYLAALTLMLAFAATVAGLVAQLARPRLPFPPRAGYAPGFMPPGAMPAGPGGPVNPFAAPGPNPFAAGAPSTAPAPNPFVAAGPGANPFAPQASALHESAPNPFAPPASGVEATVKLDPEPVGVQPPRMARVYDGKDVEGRPVVDRPALEGNARTAVLAYLESAPIVLAARSFEQDEFAPADRDVPLNFRTDGVWVWAGAVSHYLHKHGLPPEAELVRHITSRGFRVGEVGKDAQDAAIRVITGS